MRGAFIGVGQKGAVGGDARIGLEDVEDSLEAEVRHREAIDVGIDDADPDVAAGVALVEHLFVGDALEGALAWEHNKGTLGEGLEYKPESPHHKGGGQS